MSYLASLQRSACGQSGAETQAIAACGAVSVHEAGEMLGAKFAAAGRLPLKLLHGIALPNLLSLVAAFLLVLAGCASPLHAPEVAPPPTVHISESTWWQVDADISAASLAAAEVARNHARGSMDTWRDRVSQRHEADFIPWFSSYWTQQWLAIKMSWYKLNSGEGLETAEKRLALYLQEQYQDRVLNPVAREIDPDVVREDATKLYVQSLGEQLEEIAPRYGIARDQFERRLKEIPAIALGPPAERDASLYQLVHADPLARLPAYAALKGDIRKGAGTGSRPMDSRMSALANRAGEKLADQLASSGGTSVAAAAVRGLAGMVISLGAAGFGAMAHENERPQMEAQLRENLNTALDEMWLGLMEDRATGVLSGVHSISGRMEATLSQPVVRPVTSDPVPEENPASGR